MTVFFSLNNKKINLDFFQLYNIQAIAYICDQPCISYYQRSSFF